MAISDTQKVDLLYKKIAWAATKTDTNPPKEAYNEANPSPLLIRGDTLWQLSASIPASIPATTSSVVQVYKDGGGAGYTATVECTELAVTDNRTWSTGLTNWIDPQFGSTYFAKVYVDTAGSTTPQTTGIALQAAGVNDDQWYFDYQSGILNFIGTNLPASIATGITGKSVFVSGARYVGPTGVDNWPNGLAIGNIIINGNTISSKSGNVSIVGINNLFATGNIVASTFTGNINTDYITGSTGGVITFKNIGALTIPSGATVDRPPGDYGSIRYNTDSSVNTIEFWNGTTWIPFQNAISDQQITPNGVSTSYALDFPGATAESMLVSINGTVQRPGATAAYTVSGGSIVFSEAPLASDIVDLRYIASATSSRLAGLTADISTSANIMAGNLVTTSGLFWAANGVSMFAAASAVYTDANVAAYLPTHAGNVSAGNVITTNGVYWANGVNYSSTISNYTNANVAAYLPTYAGNVSAGNVITTNGVYWANGVNYSSTISNYTNANVAAYLPTYAGNVSAGNLQASVVYANVTTVSSPNIAVSTTPTVVDYFSSSSYRSAKYMIQSTAGSSVQLNEVYLIQVGGTVTITSTLLATPGANTGVFSATLVSGNVNLLFTAANTNTQLRVQKTQFLI